jgi:hypothetical protein
MISLETKAESTTSSPIGLSTPKEEPKTSFSELLKGIKDPKSDKIIQNGALILAIDSDKKVVTRSKQSLTKDLLTKEETLQSLLKNEKPLNNDLQELKSAKDVLELNPKVVDNLTQKELKTLVSEAKSFLKTKILESDGYKRAEIKELPQTLKGLAQMAKKFDIDVSKITLQEVKLNSL